MPRRKTTKTKKKPVAKNYLVFRSDCGSHSQAEFVNDAATEAAAEKIAAAVMKDAHGYYDPPRAVYITKIVKTGKTSSDVVWS